MKEFRVFFIIVLIFILLQLLCVAIATKKAKADNLILRPNGDLGTPQWETTYPADPTTHYTKVDDASVDDADYNRATAVNKQDWFSLDDASATITAGYVVDSVKIINRVKGETDDDFTVQSHSAYYKIGTDSFTFTPSFGAAFATRTSGKLTAPGGRTWSGANLDSLVLNLRKNASSVGTYYTYSSWLYVSVWYSAVSTANQSNAITKDIEDAQGITEGGIVR